MCVRAMFVCRATSQVLGWSCSPTQTLLAPDRLVTRVAGCEGALVSDPAVGRERGKALHLRSNDLSSCCLVYYNSSHRARTAKA